MGFLRLIRYQRVLLIGIIQALMYWAVILPTMEVYGVYSTTPIWIVLCTILSTMFITAGGYVINDYFDVKIDKLNRPDRLIVTRDVQKHEAMRFYQILTAVGLILGIVVAIAMRSFTLGFIFVVIPGVLWFYSASYKRQLIIGNLIVAASVALVPLMPLILEAEQLNSIYGDLLKETPLLRTLYATICMFTVFAFLWSFIREIIKDLVDEYGDREMECHTMPVVWGVKTTQIVVTILTAVACIVMAILIFALVTFDNYITLRYFLIGIVVPNICMICLMWSKGCKAYSNALNMMNFILIIGILYSILYYYLLAKQFGITLFGLFQLI